jgi:hypothetical protein
VLFSLDGYSVSCDHAYTRGFGMAGNVKNLNNAIPNSFTTERFFYGHTLDVCRLAPCRRRITSRSSSSVKSRLDVAFFPYNTPVPGPLSKRKEKAEPQNPNKDTTG